MTPLECQDCEHDARRIHELLSCGIFDQKNNNHLLRPSALIELMICLRDLLYKAEKYAGRVAFTDDIETNNYVKDITGVVTAIRDACCHIDSFKAHLDGNFNRGRFLTFYGKGVFMKGNDFELKSDYDDDIAIFFGANRLYMKRGIVRAFEEAVAKLSPFIEGNGA